MTEENNEALETHEKNQRRARTGIWLGVAVAYILGMASGLGFYMWLFG